jgi:hypothetical protein
MREILTRKEKSGIESLISTVKIDDRRERERDHV